MRYLQHANLIDDLTAQCARALRVLDGVKTLTPQAHAEYYTAWKELRRVLQRVEDQQQKQALTEQLRASITSVREQKKCQDTGGIVTFPGTGGAE